MAYNAKKVNTHSYFDNIINLFDPAGKTKTQKDPVNKHFKIMHIRKLSELDVPAEDVIFFHPRTSHDNFPWLKDVENFMDFDFPDNKYYFFGEDGGNLLKDIREQMPRFKDSRFVKVPVGPNTKSFHSHIGAAIVCWEYFKKNGELRENFTEW